MAKLWEVSYTKDNRPIVFCTLIPTIANPLLAKIHNTGSNTGRMPVILKFEDIDAWLGGSDQEATELLSAYPDGLLSADRISTRINYPNNDDAALISKQPE